MTGILETIKKLLGGGDESYTYFSPDILIHINTTLFILTQLGVGPSTGFVADEDSQWTDFIDQGIKLELVKTYVYLKVKLIFDPPTSSALMDAIKSQIAELEWRILVSVDPILIIPVPVEGGESV